MSTFFAGPPATVDDVLQRFERGELSPAEAFSLFRKLEHSPTNRIAPTLSVVPRAKPKEDDEMSQAARLRAVERELQRLIGLGSVKKLVAEVQAFIQIQSHRKAASLATEPLVLHMIFKGNPGTGKTTVARIFGKLFKEMDVLPKGHLCECERADLVGEFIGHTAQRTREQIKKALGGILFIDEAYSLARGGEKDFGKEAIDTLVKAMEDYRDQFVLILAGYQNEMEDFLLTNPGLRSRFPLHIDFPDYDVDELLQIAHVMLRQRDYRLNAAARMELRQALQRARLQGDHNFGNARLVRNTIERAIRRQAVRLMRRQHVSKEALMVIEEVDLQEVSDV